LYAAPLISLPLGFVFGNPVAFLDAPDKLVFLSSDLFPVIVRELAPLFTGLALELFPVAFDSIPIHLRYSSARSRARLGPNFQLIEETKNVQNRLRNNYVAHGAPLGRGERSQLSPRVTLSRTCSEHAISCKFRSWPLGLANIHSLSDFQRNAKNYIRKLKQSGNLAILTVNGEAEVVVQSAEAYQELLDDRELLDSIRNISRGLEQAKRGGGRAMRGFLEALAKEPASP
jgi:PHD/YefM family antitoxin component YafN of YafNO toxin-antitoxin module